MLTRSEMHVAEIDEYFTSPAAIREQLNVTPRWRLIRRHTLRMDLFQSEQVITEDWGCTGDPEIDNPHHD